MKNKLTKNEWVAVAVSLAFALFIVFYSLQNSPYLQSEGDYNTNEALELNIPKDINMTEENNSETKSLIVEDINVGTGKEAAAGNLIKVNYAGTLTDGTEFDSNWNKEAPFEFILETGQVIQGWDVGVVGMKEGGVRKLIIPASMAYGDRGAGNVIPPNSDLIFTVELLEVVSN